MLYERVVEIDERVGVDGEVLVPLDEAARAGGAASTFGEPGIDALAIVLMHGWRHAAHEARLAEIARELGFTQISVSHEVAPLIKLIGRGDTTVVDAYLSPVLRRYVDRVAAGFPTRPTSTSCSRTAASPKRPHFAARTRSCPAPPAASSAWSRRARRTAAIG